jgi:hypothetical protein
VLILEKLKSRNILKKVISGIGLVGLGMVFSAYYLRDGSDKRLTDAELYDCYKNKVEDVEIPMAQRIDLLQHPIQPKIEHFDVGGAGDIGVMHADGRVKNTTNDNRVYVAPLPYNLILSDVGQRYVEDLARGTKSEVIGVEFPGVGDPGKSSASWSEIGDMLMGGFSEAAEINRQVIEKMVNLRDKKVTVIGYSSGADVGAYLVNDMIKNGINVDKFVMVDPVNSKLSPLGLIDNSTKEGKFNIYQESGKKDGGIIGDQIPLTLNRINQIANLALSGRALLGGISAERINEISKLGVNTIYIKLKDSTMSNMVDACNDSKVIEEQDNQAGIGKFEIWNVSSDSKLGTHHPIVYSSGFLTNMGSLINSGN